jgi:hypothetical protein
MISVTMGNFRWNVQRNHGTLQVQKEVLPHVRYCLCNRLITPLFWSWRYNGKYLTIIRRRRGDYRGIFAETKSR